MRRTITALVAGVFAATTLVACGTDDGTDDSAAAQAGPGDQTAALWEGITVVGVGEVDARPDTVRLRLGVTVDRPTAQEALEVAATEAQAVIDVLTAAGVPEEEIQTQRLAVTQLRTRPEDGPPQPAGYQVTNVVTAEVGALDEAGAIVDQAVAAAGDAVVVEGIEFVLDDDVAALEQARQRAFEDARAKAEQLAALSERELGQAEAIGELVSGGRPPIPLAGAEVVAQDAASTPVQPGQVTNRVEVTVRFSFA